MERVQCRLTQSIEARLLAIRIAIQDNRGKRTASIKGVNSEFKGVLNKILLDGCSSPLKKIEISDRISGSKRFLFVPTLTDFIKQKLVTLALDPQ